jgi:hypothetical protein
MKYMGEVCPKITENAKIMMINDAAADKLRN